MKTTDKTTIQLTDDLHIEVERSIFHHHAGDVWVVLETPRRAYRGGCAQGNIQAAQATAERELRREFNRWLMSTSIDPFDPHGDAWRRI
jgi:hypothetical protein